MKWIVYCTTCTENGKIYIGVHKTENPEVFDGYIGNGLKVGWEIKNPHTAFQYAIKKYGYGKFKRNTLYVFDSEELAYAKEAEIVDLNFVKRRDNYNSCLGGIHSGIVCDSLYQYDFEGNLIKEWNSVGEAVKYYGCNSNRFNMAIKDKRSAFNSYWSKTKFDRLPLEFYTKSKHSEIYVYDEQGNLFNIYNSVSEIVEKLGFTKSSVEDACSHKHPLKGLYFISDNTNIINLIKTRTMIYNLSDKSVSKYKNKILIRTYSSLNQAAKENNLTTNQIKKEIANKTGNWAYGYKETYDETLITPTSL